MASSGTAVLSTPTDTQILMTREFDAPVHLVWRAYTEPELVSKWWPGKRGTMQSCEIDFRVGGVLALRDDRLARASRSPSTASIRRSSRASGSSTPRSSRARPARASS